MEGAGWDLEALFCRVIVRMMQVLLSEEGKVLLELRACYGVSFTTATKLSAINK